MFKVVRISIEHNASTSKFEKYLPRVPILVQISIQIKSSEKNNSSQIDK